ncbi:ATP synthase subunit b [Arthrobacter sp. Hiyo1]|nr:ATP synthase subunit b [Arthrobacter sp. Hiyo1]
MNQQIISAAAQGAAESANPLVPNLWEMGVVFAGFVVLLYIVVKFVVPMFEKTFAERAEAIEGGIAKLKRPRPKLLQLSKSTSSSSTMPAPKPTASAKKLEPKVPRSSRS